MVWLVKRTAAVGAALACLASGSPARADDALPDGWLEAKLNERGQHCDRRGELRDGERLLLACGAAGVWHIALEEAGPRLVRSYAFSGEAVGVFAEPDGRLWVKLQLLEARPLTLGAGAGAVSFPDEGPDATPRSDERAVAPPPPSVPPKRETETAALPAQTGVGRVLFVEPGEVVISLGAADGLTRSDRIELAQESGDGPEESLLSREVLAVGVVTHLSEHSARVRLGMNEAVPVGSLAAPSRAQPTASLSAPPRAAPIWTLSLAARPFVALGELGGGMLLSGSIGRRFVGPLHLQAVVDPIAFAAVESNQGSGAQNAAVIASYDSRFFEMGLGFGAQSVNDTSFFVKPGSGLSVVQLIRLGAEDGLNLFARTSVVLFHSQFEFGGMVASLQIPVSRGYWLLLAGGGGEVGYGYGEFGLKALLSGNGGTGSKFLLVSAGGAGVFESGSCAPFSPCGTNLSYGGPMAGIGGEWRF
jgi:hypothetical protein